MCNDMNVSAYVTPWERHNKQKIKIQMYRHLLEETKMDQK